MKRMLIAVTIAFFAIVSQAATVTWSINNVQSSPSNAVGDGWIVAIYSADVSFDYDKAVAGEITALSTSTVAKSGSVFKASSTFGDYLAGTAINTYAVIFDANSMDGASNYIVSDILNKRIADNGANLTLSFGNMGGTQASNMFLHSEWQAVPEPTTGLLLLLGMAGLALRRKQAYSFFS